VTNSSMPLCTRVDPVVSFTLRLIGHWGPIVVSVGNLLTIGSLFFIRHHCRTRMEVNHALKLAGSGAIVVAFGILVLRYGAHTQSHN